MSKAHRPLYHSILGSRAIKMRRESTHADTTGVASGSATRTARERRPKWTRLPRPVQMRTWLGGYRCTLLMRNRAPLRLYSRTVPICLGPYGGPHGARTQGEVDATTASGTNANPATGVQGYLAHKKPAPPTILQ